MHMYKCAHACMHSYASMSRNKYVHVNRFTCMHVCMFACFFMIPNCKAMQAAFWCEKKPTNEFKYHDVITKFSGPPTPTCGEYAFLSFNIFLMMTNHDNAIVKHFFYLFKHHIFVPPIPIRVQVGMFWSMWGLTTNQLSYKHIYMQTYIHANMLAYTHAFTSIHMYMHLHSCNHLGPVLLRNQMNLITHESLRNITTLS